MPKSILVDLNVIVDVLLERQGFESSTSIIELGEQNKLSLNISAHMVTTFAYLLEAAKVPNTQLIEQIRWLLELFIVVPVDTTLLKSALKSKVQDYEDAVVESAALSCGASVIVTRNIKDFTSSLVPARTPEDYLSKLDA